MADAELGFVPAILAAAAVAGLIALVVGIALTRMEENAMAMATIGLLVIAFVVFESWDEVTRGSTGLFGVPLQTTIWWALALRAAEHRDRAAVPREPAGPDAALQPRGPPGGLGARRRRRAAAARARGCCRRR